MNSFEIEVEFESRCEVCGNILEIDISDKYNMRDYKLIEVQPCKCCIEDARAEVKNQMQEEIDEFKEKIEELEG